MMLSRPRLCRLKARHRGLGQSTKHRSWQLRELLMPRDIHPDTHAWSRRRILGAAMATVAVAEVGLVGVARGNTAIVARTGSMPGTLKQIDAGVLNVGYVEAGPADGPAVILLHGWPYDMHAFAEVVPILTGAGYR